MTEQLTIGDRTFDSRLILGTGKYENQKVMKEALDASGTELVTVALRRVDLEGEENLLDVIDTDQYTLLPNTAGCETAEEAVRTARLARELGMEDMIKLEVIGDEETLYPDNEETLEAAQTLVDEGFEVMAYTNEDLIAALKLQEAGVSAVMPLGAPIGSGRGMLNPTNIHFIVRRLETPVIVDAGVGTASDVSEVMELGADGVLVNTGIARANEPVKMARAMKQACEAGNMAYEAGRIPEKRYASPSSPQEGVFF